MGKLLDRFIDWALAGKRWPLLLPVGVVPIALGTIQHRYSLGVTEALSDCVFWISTGVIVLISGLLFWLVARSGLKLIPMNLKVVSGLLPIVLLAGLAYLRCVRERAFRLRVSVVLVLVGLIVIAFEAWPASLPEDKLVVAIAKFDTSGADANTFQDDLFSNLKKVKGASLLVRTIPYTIKESIEGEGERRASTLGRSCQASHVLLWGKLTKEEGDTMVTPHITFARRLRAVRLDETEMGGFFPADRQTLSIKPDAYAKHVANLVALVQGLYYYEAHEWEQALNAFEAVNTEAAVLYAGLCLYQKAQKSQEPQLLKAAIERFDSVLSTVGTGPAGEYDEFRRAAGLNRASALAALSGYLPAKEARCRLEEAKKSFDAVIRLYTEHGLDTEDKKRDWAKAQSDLGSVLTDLALLAGGGARQLSQAIGSYRQALETYPDRTEWAINPKDSRRTDWAITQKNLGTAYTELALREKGVQALEDLDHALEAYKAATVVFNRNDSPRHWATIWVYVAGALAEQAGRRAELGDQQSSEQAFRSANDGCNDAFLVFTERDQNWADAKANLAYVSYLWGKSKSSEEGNNLLEGAVNASEDALSVYTEGDLSWAIAKETLGASWGELGVRIPGEGAKKFLEWAIAAYGDALGVRDQPEESMNCETTQKRMDGANQHGSGIPDQIRHNEDCAKTHSKLGDVLVELGTRVVVQARGPLRTKAIENFEIARSVYDEERKGDQYDEQRKELHAKIEKAKRLLGA